MRKDGSTLILVTGATGFVGRALCRALRGADRPFRAVSRSGDAGYFGIGDIGPMTDWTAALTGVDVVVHLAARVHVMQDQSVDPLAAYRLTNRDGTLNLARQAREAGVKRLIFVSSIKVNGESTAPGRPFRSTDAPAPIDPYGRSKHEAEQGLRAIAAETELEVVIIRPPLIYGPGVKANFRAILTLVEHGVPVPLGAIHNKRSLVSVNNLVDLIVCCLDHPRAAGETLLVSDGQDLSTTELLRALARSFRRSARIFPVPEPWLRLAAATLGRGDAAQRLLGSLQVDISHTCDLLGWAPPLSVDAAFALASKEGWSMPDVVVRSKELPDA